MILTKFIKQPSEIKDYDVEYAEWLSSYADTLDSAVTNVVCLSTPEDTSLVCTGAFLLPTRVKLWMAGGTAGEKYKLTLQVQTVGGRLDESELLFTIKEF